MKRGHYKMLKRITQAVAIDFFLVLITISLVSVSSLSKYFWGLIAFLIALGNLLFSSQIDVVTSSLFKKGKQCHEKKKSFSSSEIREQRKNYKNKKIAKSFHYIQYNVYVAVITLGYSFFGTEQFHWGVVIFEAGVILMLFGLVLFLIPWIKKKADEHDLL